jgi:peroxiredoxin
MKRFTPFLLIILIPLFSRAQQADPSTLVKTGDAAPSFTFNISKDQQANFSDYKGKVVMINFFATWCPPCRLELPRVQKEIWEKYKDNPKFALFIFGREQDWDVVLPFKEKNQYTFLMLPDKDKKIYGLYATQFIPRNVIVDENGKVIYQSIGYSEAEFNKLLDLLADKLKPKS